jgi:hypothetical protein
MWHEMATAVVRPDQRKDVKLLIENRMEVHLDNSVILA